MSLKWRTMGFNKFGQLDALGLAHQEDSSFLLDIKQSWSQIWIKMSGPDAAAPRWSVFGWDATNPKYEALLAPAQINAKEERLIILEVAPTWECLGAVIERSDRRELLLIDRSGQTHVVAQDNTKTMSQLACSSTSLFYSYEIFGCTLLEEIELQPSPNLIPRSLGFPSEIRISKISCGQTHTVVLSEDNYCYSFGSGSFGQLGHGDVMKEVLPRLIDALGGLDVIDVACGGWHTLFLTSSGDVYSCGQNTFGQLGRRSSAFEDESSALPLPVDFPSNVVLPCNFPSSSTLGNISSPLDKKCSQPFSPLLEKPHIEAADDDVQILTIAAGSVHSLALTSTGTLVGWGCNQYGQLGFENKENVSRPRIINVVGPHAKLYCSATSWSSIYSSE